MLNFDLNYAYLKYNLKTILDMLWLQIIVLSKIYSCVIL